MVNVETSSAGGRNKEGEIRGKRKRDVDVEATFSEVVASRAEGVAEDGENRKKRKRVNDGISVEATTGTDGNKVWSGADSLKKIETEKSDSSNERKKKKKKRKHSSLHEQPPMQEDMDEKLGDLGVVVGDGNVDGRKGRHEKSVEEGIETKNSEQSIDRKKEKKNKKKHSMDGRKGSHGKSVEEGIETENSEKSIDRKNEKKKKKMKKHSMDEEPVLQEVLVGNNHAGGKAIRQARDSLYETVTENSEDPNDGKKEKKKRKQRIVPEAASQETPAGDNEANPKEVDITKTKNSESLEDRKKKKKQKVEPEPVSREAHVRNIEANTKEADKATTKNSESSESRKKKEKKKKKNKSIDQEQPARTKSGRSGSNRVEKDASDSSPPKSTTKRVRFSEVVQVIPIFDDDDSVRGKPFSPEEDELIKAAVLDYINSHALGDEGVNMVMNCRKHKETKNCWNEITSALPRRPRKSVISRAHIIFERSEERKWTPEECNFVLSYHEKHGPDWSSCAKVMGKNRIHVKDAFRRLNVKNRKSGRWTQDEYQGLFDLVNTDLRMKVHEERKSKHGMLKDNISWAAISEKLGTRVQAHCSNKWYKQLASPMVADDKWCDMDDYQLVMELYNLDACCMEDVDWDNLLEHRSGELCRKRWNQMVKHLGDTRDKSFGYLMAPERHRILMVSDFFYPNFGGVENHIYYLSQCLLELGHKVVVMTHAYGNRSGVRYMTGGLKVYYVPWRPFVMQNTLPTFYGTLPIVRTILIREQISLVHGHQAFSTLCHEALMHARTMGYKVVFTDHSLYGFSDVGSIHMNKVLQFTLADVTQAICVSHTSKENTVLRSGIPPEKVYMIPNAVDTAMFKPAEERPGGNEIVIVVISRLVYRKGADLLVEVIPEVCRLYPNVRFIVGGDGPKRVRLEEMREKHSLQDRVDMLGAVPHASVRSVLITGHIFLNSSLTEAFCIAILEAASCGLLTVLPDDMIVLAEPDPTDMVQAIKKAISLLPGIDPQAMHERMKKLYDWHDVAKRTEIVYDRALKCPNQPLLGRLSRYLSCGSWAGKLFCLVMTIDFLLWHMLKLWQPEEDIDKVPDFVIPTGETSSAFDQELDDQSSS
ncbi:unnamed protein product [Linum tenue]|uniref:phosphatidylinositol N-acetylglucosaminyltransferase n=1 Tax=Linum tenue TaxID=586396 RepID=A0AAV0N2L6_9ROSI|nr:unnamed protein product [Linum tenue]